MERESVVKMVLQFPGRGAIVRKICIDDDTTTMAALELITGEQNCKGRLPEVLVGVKKTC